MSAHYFVRSVIIVSVSRDSVDEFANINMLGDARDFLENLNWTNDALRDLQSVNINRTHTMQCGYSV